MLEETGLRLCALMADMKPEKEDSKHYSSLSHLTGLIQMAHDLCPEKPPLIQTILGRKEMGRVEESLPRSIGGLESDSRGSERLPLDQAASKPRHV